MDDVVALLAAVRCDPRRDDVKPYLRSEKNDVNWGNIKDMMGDSGADGTLGHTTTVIPQHVVIECHQSRLSLVDKIPCPQCSSTHRPKYKSIKINKINQSTF